MNLTGPHQFTRSYYELTEEFRPILVSHDDVEWVYSSRFGEFISPFKFMKHYSSFKKLKTIDSTKRIDLPQLSKESTFKMMCNFLSETILKNKILFANIIVLKGKKYENNSQK